MAIIFPEIDLTDIDAVFIDIDDTLYQYERCHEAALKACYDYAQEGENFSEISQDEFYGLYKKHRDIVTECLSPQGACRSRLIAFMNMFEELKLEIPYSLAQIYDKIYWDTLIAYIQNEPSVTDFLINVYNHNIPVVAVTDMLTDIQIRKIQKLGYEKYINFIVSSEEAGAEKPFSQIFQLALIKCGANASKSIMIGDSVSKDKVGAENMGIRFYQVLNV